MKKILPFIFIIVCSDCFAQVFQKVYGDSLYQAGAYFLTAPDSGFHLLSREINPSACNILRLTNNGDTMHSNNFTFYSPPYTCIHCTDNFVLLSNIQDSIGVGQYRDTVFISKFDTAGNMISTWMYPDTTLMWAQVITQSSDKGFVVCGITLVSISEVFIMKVDSLGNLQWKKKHLPLLPTYGWNQVIDLQETPDQFFIAEIARNSGSPHSAGNKHMMKFDSNGNLVWMDTLTYGFAFGTLQQIVITDSGYIYVDNENTNHNTTVGSSRISLVDTSGIIRWTKVYFDYSTYYTGFANIPTGGFYLWGRKRLNNGDWPIIVTRLDQNADSVESYFYNFHTLAYSAYMGFLQDNKFGLVGNIQWSYAYGSDIFFIVADSTGNVIASSSEYFSENQPDLLIYPNPTISTITVSANFTRKNSLLEIFSTLGEKIYAASAVSRGPWTVDFRPFPPGIYFVRLSNSDKQQTQKLVISGN
jgi:hypothetical protein